MANFRTIFLPSAVEGKHWSIGYHKPAGRPGVVSATEGELASTSTSGITFFRAILFESRHFRREVSGRATKRAIATTLMALLHEMEASNALAPGAADRLKAQAATV